MLTPAPPEQKKMNKLSEQQKKELIKLMGELLEPHIPALSDAFQRFGKWLEDVSKKHSSLIYQALTADWQKISERLEQLPARSRKAMDTASNQGWFFIWQDSMQTVLALIDDIEAAGDDQNHIDTILKEHYSEHIDSYSEQLYKAYPARRIVLESATLAHKELGARGYCLSIPVFLAQADGIFSEVSKTSMALGNPRKKGSKEVRGVEWVRNTIGEDEDANGLLSPLFVLHQSNLLKTEKMRNADFESTGIAFNSLNRHQVLHGEVSDYGSEINSLKAFSFLAFVGLHLPTILASTRFDTE